MKTYLTLFLSLVLASLMSCTQQKGPSEQEVQERIDAAVKKALAEKSASSDTEASTCTSESSGNSSSPSTSKNTSTSSSEKRSNSSPVGEYRFSDDYDDYTLIINSDETCQIMSNGKTFYGSWDDWCNKAYWIKNSESLYLTLNGKKEYWSPMIDFALQWMYAGGSAFNAKDPTKRVKLTRVK